MEKKPLPEKLSALIRDAVDDLDKCEADPFYRIDMKQWHTPNPESGLCYVCLAGAYLAKSRHYVPAFDIDQSNADPEECAAFDKIAALDNIRLGQIISAVEEYYSITTDLEEEDGWGHCYVPPYEKDPAQFKAVVRGIAERLEAAGY